MMDITEPIINRKGPVRALAKFKWSMGLVGWRKVAVAATVLVVLHTMRLLNIHWLNYEKRLNWQANPEWGYASSFLVGSIFAAGWTPCVGTILSGILLLASASQTVGQGAALLFVYSLGLGIPFLLTGLALNRMSGLLRRLNRCQNVISVVSGLFLIGMGVLVYTNFLSIMSGYFYRYVGTFL
jgi:cytochrome c-type biogenesis protein